MPPASVEGVLVRSPAILRRAALAVFISFLVLAVIERVGLFADGSYQLLSTVLDRGLLPTPHNRVFSEAIRHAPLILALRAGLTDLNLLELSYFVGLFFHFALMMFICARAAAKRPEFLVFPIASFFLLSANMSFWAFTGAHVMVSIYWALLYALLFPARWTAGWVTVSLFLALLATAAFESMLFLGLILAIAAEWRRRQESQRLARAAAAVVLALALFGVLVALSGVAARGGDHFTRAPFTLRDGAGRWHGMMVLSLGALPLLISAGTAQVRTWRTVAMMFLAACTGWLALTITRAEAVLTFSVQHETRTFNLWFTLALTALLAVRLVQRPSTRSWIHSWLLVTAFGVAQVVWLVNAGRHWRTYLDLVAVEVRTRTGIVPYESTPLRHNTVDGMVINRLTWGWTLPVLSVLHAPQGEVRAIIDNPAWYDGDFVAFDPADPSALLGLRRFGIVAHPLARDSLVR